MPTRPKGILHDHIAAADERSILLADERASITASPGGFSGAPQLCAQAHVLTIADVTYRIQSI